MPDERWKDLRIERRKDLRHERQMTRATELGAAAAGLALIVFAVTAILAPEVVHGVLSQIGRLAYDVAKAFGTLLRRWGMPS